MTPDSRHVPDDVSASRDSTLPLTQRSGWADEDEETIDLGWYGRAILRRWKVAVAGAAVCGAIAFSYASFQRVVYEGVTTLLVVSRILPSGVQINPATFSSIVKNSTLASQVIEELKLQGEVTPQAFLEHALEIESVPGSNVVNVKVRLSDPKNAAEASHRLTRKAILLAQQVSQQQGEPAADQLKRHLDEARDRLQTTEQALLSYKQRTQVELLRRDADAMLKERGDLLQVIIEIEAERARLAAAELEIKRQPPLATGAPLRTQPAPTAGAQTPQPEVMSSVLNPVYQSLAVQIATSRTRIAALEKERDHLTNVRKLGDKELAQLSELYRRQIEEARLQASFDLAKRLYDELALRYEQSRIEPLANVAPLQILDEGLPSETPVSRRRLQYAAVGSATGFIGAVFLALVWESLGRRTRHAS